MEFLLILVYWFGFQKYIDIMQIYKNSSVDTRRVVCVFCMYIRRAGTRKESTIFNNSEKVGNVSSHGPVRYLFADWPGGCC